MQWHPGLPQRMNRRAILPGRTKPSVPSAALSASYCCSAVVWRFAIPRYSNACLTVAKSVSIVPDRHALSRAPPASRRMTLRPRAGRPPRTAPPGAVHRTHHLGPHPIITHFLERLMLEGIIRGCVGSARQGIIDHARTLVVLVHNLLVSPGPLYRIATWLAPVEPAVVGLTPAQAAAINDDRIA